MKPLLVLLLLFSTLIGAMSASTAAAKRGDIIYQCTFADAGAASGWQGLDNQAISLAASPPSAKALRIANPVNGAHNAAASIPLDVAKVRGLRLSISAKVKASDVVKPEHSWNGVKVVLVSKSPTGDQYDQLPNVYGTFDWRDINFTSKVPENATSVTLVLAVENTSGTAEFDDLKVTVLEAPLDPKVRRVAAKRGDIVFHCSFADPSTNSGWQGLDSPSVSLAASPPSLKALRISNPIAGSHNTAVSTDLDVAALRGLRVVVSAKVKATDVVKPEHAYNGIKVMLIVKKPGGDQYDQQLDVNGTFDWREIRFGSEIPYDATSVSLVLGVENTSGTADFDDVSITVLEAPRNPAIKAAVGPAYTGHGPDRLRGAMVSHSIVEADAAKLADVWKANVIRFQLIGSQGGPADLGPSYDTWLEGELVKLDRFLPIATKHGVLVLVDMHSAPGGRISSYVGDRIFEDVRYQDKLADAWVKISKRYKGNAAVWGYDLCNEPLERTTRDTVPGWEALATRLARIVRGNDAKHAIIVESMNSDASEFRYLSPIPVKGIVYSAHLYTPYTYTMQGVGGAWHPVQYPGSIDGETWNKAKLAQVLQPVVDFQKQCNVAIYIGEFSAVRWAPNSSQWLSDAIDIFESNHWDWSYHAFREWPGWDAEYPADHDATAPSATPTERETLLKSYYARNNAATVAGN